MGKMLICENSHCRFLLDLRHAGKDVGQTALVLNGCPECGSGWANHCPACGEALSATMSGHHAFCSACKQPLQQHKSRTHSRAA